MAFVDDPNKNSQDGSNVNATPLSNAAPEQTGAANMAPQGDMGASQSSQIQSGSQTPSTNKKAPKASSGMFTNIQKYVDKNKPQAVKLADSSVQDIKNTQDNIKKQQQETLKQFTGQAQASGLQDTQSRVNDVSAYTRDQSGLTAQQPAPNAPIPDSGATEAVAPTAPVTEQAPGINENKFASIINAKYDGPRNLTESGNLFQKSLEQANKAGRIGELAQSTQGREQLLQDKFTKGGREYGRGASQLDNLLLNQQTGQLKQIEDLGRNIGSSQDIMKSISGQTSNVANQTQSQVLETKNQARDAFKNLSAERQGQVDTRVGEVVENWDKLPAHFREVFSKADGSVDLSAVEAATLGMDGSTRLFNIADKYTPDELFGGVDANKKQLISKNEQANLARLQALSNLSQGGEKLYDIGDYFNADQAGTQTATDALNLEGFADKLAATEQGFQDDITNKQTGKGYKKVSRGNAWGTKTKKYRATAEDTLANQLEMQQNQAVSSIMESNPGVTAEQARDYAQKQGLGYQSGDIERLNTNPDVLGALANISQNYTVDANGGKFNIDGANRADSITGNNIDASDIGLIAAGGFAAPLIRDGLLGDVGSQAFNLASGFAGAPGEIASSIGNSISDSGIGGDIGKFAGGTISTIGDAYSDVKKAFSGIDTGAMNKYGSAKAQSQANKNLLNKLTAEQKRLGTSNIANVADTKETQERTARLMDMLKNLDLTNR
jgi:hypothetical protein